MMRIVLVCLAAFGLASAAQAVTFTATSGAPDPGPTADQSIVVSFDAPNAAGFTWTGGPATSCSSISGAAMPAIGPGGTTSCFGYVSSAIEPGVATLSTPNLSSISFYWGSIDAYNFVDVLGAGGATILSISGNMLPPANGHQSLPGTNSRVNFVADAGEVITGLRLRSTGIAFEFDNFAAATAIDPTVGPGVPEPASWAMLLAGFGLVGAAARRRRPVVAA